jgi:hypothetical protein
MNRYNVKVTEARPWRLAMGRTVRVILAVAFSVLLFPDVMYAGSLGRAMTRGALRGLTRPAERGAARAMERRTLRSLERSRLRNMTRWDLIIRERTRPAPVTNPHEVFQFPTRDRALDQLRNVPRP